MGRFLLALAVSLSICMMVVDNIRAETGEVKPETVITADKMVTENKNNLIRFYGNVVAIYTDLILKSNELEVYSNEQQQSARKVVATGDIVITKGKRTVTGQHAELYNVEKKLVITGDATVVEEGNRITGEKIVYFYDKEDIIVTGGTGQRATVLLAPKK